MTRTIVHTTDLDHNDAALAHAVALARAGNAKLVSLHANAPQSAVERIPDASELLRSWGGAPDAIDHDKQVHNCCDDPVDTILDALRALDPDLVVAATHRRSTLARFFVGSRAEAIARNVAAPTLLLPADANGFVGEHDGAVDLRRMLIPIGDPEEARAAVRAASWLGRFAGSQTVELELLHVGERVPVPTDALDVPVGWSITPNDLPSGDIDRAILGRTEEACVVVMATRGHDSAHDALLGSHIDHVLHSSRCPVLSVAV